MVVDIVALRNPCSYTVSTRALSDRSAEYQSDNAEQLRTPIGIDIIYIYIYIYIYIVYYSIAYNKSQLDCQLLDYSLGIPYS